MEWNEFVEQDKQETIVSTNEKFVSTMGESEEGNPLKKLIFDEEGDLTLGADIALAGAAYGGTAIALAPTGPGVLATSVIAAPMYMAAKYALTGKAPEPMIPAEEGVISSPIGSTMLGAAEEAALWMLPMPMLKGGLKSKVKGLGRGVERVAEKLSAPVRKYGAPVAEKAWNILSIPIEVQIPGKDKSLREMWEAAITRIEKKIPKAAERIRESKIQNELISEAGRNLGTRLQSMNPKEAYEVGKALKEGGFTAGVKGKEAKAAIKDFNTAIKEAKVDEKYRVEFRKQLTRLNLVPKDLPSDKAFKKLAVSEKPTVNEVHSVLEAVIENPKASGQMKELAKDLWNLPANTPSAVVEASRKASRAVLIDKLKTTRGVVSAIPKAGYVESRIKEFKKAYVHKDVELELNAMDQIPKLAERMFNRFFMTPWKTAKVILRPASHIRNLFSNIILNDFGGLPFYRGDVYVDAVKGIRGNSPVWKEFSRMTGVQAASFSSSDLAQISHAMGAAGSRKGYGKSVKEAFQGAGGRYDDGVFTKALNVFDAIVAPARTLYGAEESMFKYAKYLHNMEKGMAKREAAWDAMKWTFNFGEVTPEVAAIGQYAMPFVRWFSKVIPLGLETVKNHPVRFAKWIGMGATMQQLALSKTQVSEEEWQKVNRDLPEYMTRGLYLLMPFRDEKNRLNMLDLTFVIPFIGDVAELYQKNPFEVVLQNPVFTMASTLISKRKYSGVPLYYDWEDPSTKMMKTFAYAWEQLSPAMLPGGTDWNKLSAAFSDQEGALSPEVAIANALGMKLVAVDEKLNRRRKESVLKIYEREIRSNMMRELRNARSPEEKSEIVDKYRKLQRKTRGIGGDEE